MRQKRGEGGTRSILLIKMKEDTIKPTENLCDYLGGKADNYLGICIVKIGKHQIESASEEWDRGEPMTIRLKGYPFIELLGSVAGISSGGYSLEVTEIRPRKIFVDVDVPLRQ